MRQLIQVGALGAALLFTLVGSYLVYFDDSDGPAADAEGVPVYVASVDQLQKVTWSEGDKTIVLERKNDGADFLEITVTTVEEVVPDVPVALVADSDGTDDTDAQAAPVEPPAPERVETVQRFIGNAQADELWADFAPFMADRSLEGGDVEFGFDEPFATLSVQRTTGPVEVVFGAATYGDRARYLRTGDKIFLVKKRAITSIQSTDKLMDRDLQPLETSDVDEVTVQADGVSRTLTQRNPDDRARSYWADAATPDTRDEVASAWVPSLLGLRARAYVDAAPDGLGTVLSATVKGDGATYSIEVLSDGADDATWYARTSHNRGVVELTDSQAQELTADLAGVMSPSSAPTE